ncbi:tryptophan-rich sensory protein [Anabaena cylindrica UHCC 0172]|uniref:tryptophan-rich sensory protein n=1 Tax=Anabaena cylindrica TaxID=1165 RepID=UPI002B1F44A4|nr:tryptophan-rich sensory protein [Anabaena cylindrica]MEA5549384.1 tryptophan-rich sensory protein [Anabaena cylindrica UHCC 0172]
MNKSASGNNQDFFRQLATLAAIVGAFVINVLSNIFPLNGINIGEISNTVFKEVLIIPANYAFAIWGLIYLGLFALGVYQFLPNQKTDSDLCRTGYLLVIASVAQSIWVYLFLSKLFAFSIVAMLGILIPLIIIYQRLEIGRKRVSKNKKLCLHVPISIYLSWISVATIVNVASVLYFYGWNGWGFTNEIWTVIMLLAAAAITSVMVIQYRDIAYAGVTIWAVIAIALKHWDNPVIKYAALLLAIVLIVITIIKNPRLAGNG